MWIITTWQHISPEVTVKGFKKFCISSETDGADDDMLRMTAKRLGMLEMSATKTNALTVKMEALTVIGNGR
jgi:hypothetical protein